MTHALVAGVHGNQLHCFAVLLTHGALTTALRETPSGAWRRVAAQDPWFTAAVNRIVPVG